MQLEGERQQEAEKAAKVHDEMREAHTRLKRLDKDLKQLTTHQASTLPAIVSSSACAALPAHALVCTQYQCLQLLQRLVSAATCTICLIRTKVLSMHCQGLFCLQHQTHSAW